MRSYYAHLGTTVPTSTATPIAPRPTLRSSALFPVLQRQGISSRVLFMGYWLLKRRIHEVTCIVTLRAEDGSMLSRTTMTITTAKAFSIELADQLAHSGQARDADFSGSLEIEFFAAHDLVFPYPAVVVNYYGPHFSSVVHSAQRTYNDFEDKEKNSQTDVPESGFNIYADGQQEPFVSLINGPVAAEASSLSLQFINHAQKVLSERIPLGPLAPYQTVFIYPARSLPLEEFLEGQPGACKAKFHLDWVFPRLIVGNIHRHIPAITITHTYYDCSNACSPADYWLPSEPGWHAASLMIPALVSDNYFSNAYFYAIYSPSTFAVDVEIYDAAGTLLGSVPDAVTVKAPHEHYHCIELKKICRSLKIASTAPLGARLIARPLEGSRLPARVKIGIDVGIEGYQSPCNICANLHPFNPSLETKPLSFRWSPVLADQPKALFWMMNSSPFIDYRREAEIHFTFFRESDEETLKRTVILPPNGFMELDANGDPELKAFFQGKVGWLSATTSNPYTTCYYFAEHDSGVVGGDHGF